MRFTVQVARSLADAAGKFTGGEIGWEEIRDDPYCYMIPQEIAAFFIGVMLGWARCTATEIPEEIRDLVRPIQDSYRPGPRMPAMQERGEKLARSRAASAGKLVPMDER